MGRTLKLANETVNYYLSMLKSTETPPIMHAWALIAAAGACMTRRRWWDVGSLRYYPNQYIMLTGPAGVRKSTAISIARKLVEDIPGFRFGPNSTAGRLQGLVAMMAGATEASDQDEKEFKDTVDSLSATLQLGGDLSDLAADPGHRLNRAALWAAEGELVTFLGRQSDEFISFLGDMWDNPPHFSYRVRRDALHVDFPCLNILGGITPMHITTYLPPTAIGQGFSSRVIFVYADTSENKTIPWPDPLDDAALREMKAVMLAIFTNNNESFNYTAEVKKRMIELYSYSVPIDDVRFLHYCQRRQAHLAKIAMALAALRLSDTIELQDVDDAQHLLVLTEEKMPDAIGTHGLTEAALAKARLIEYLRSRTEPVTQIRLMVSVGTDIRKADFQRALLDLMDTKQVVQVEMEDKTGFKKYGYVIPRAENAFKSKGVVRVDYAFDDEEQGPAKGGVRPSAKNAAAALDDEDAGGEKPLAGGLRLEGMQAARDQLEENEKPPAKAAPLAPQAGMTTLELLLARGQQTRMQ